VFGKRFQNELEQLKKDVAKWQNSPILIEEKNGNGEVKEKADILQSLNFTTKTTTETTATQREETKGDGVEIRERGITSSVVTEIS
jgi:hypothetical protein